MTQTFLLVEVVSSPPPSLSLGHKNKTKAAEQQIVVETQVERNESEMNRNRFSFFRKTKQKIPAKFL